MKVCTNFEINRYKIYEFRKHANIVCFIGRHVKKKRYLVRHSQPEVSTTSGSKVMAQTVVFMLLVALSVTYVILFVTRTGHEVLESPCEIS